MESIQQIFLTHTITDLTKSEYDMKYVKFIFDDETLKGLINYLDKNDKKSYYEGLKSIDYLYSIKKEKKKGIEGVYIPVRDSKKFFSLLEELIRKYAERPAQTKSLLCPSNFIRSIWLRMGVNDINNVETFLERQLKFLRYDKVLEKMMGSTICELNDRDILSFRVGTNEDWFETNQYISFCIHRKSESDSLEEILFDSKEYNFPRIHYGLTKENSHVKCFIYGIQSKHERRDIEVKEFLQPIRSKLRNKYVASDFIIGMSLFLDFLYEEGVYEIEIPPIQVYNYEYHEILSKNEKKKHQENGNSQDKDDEKKFEDKEELISHNKTERFIEMFSIIMDMNPNIELINEPFVNGENMIIHLHGKTDILKDYNKEKERAIS